MDQFVYSIVLRMNPNFDRAILVKANGMHDALKLARKYRGTIMSCTQVLVDPQKRDAMDAARNGVK